MLSPLVKTVLCLPIVILIEEPDDVVSIMLISVGVGKELKLEKMAHVWNFSLS